MPYNDDLFIDFNETMAEYKKNNEVKQNEFRRKYGIKPGIQRSNEKI